MMIPDHVKSLLARPSVLAASYAAITGLFAALAIFFAINLFVEYRDRNTTAQLLKRMESSATTRGALHEQSSRHAEAVYFSAESPSLANAKLLQDLKSSIVNAQGDIRSTEINDRPRPGEVKATAKFEISEQNLQKVLYDLEAGAPFLFIDNLAISASSSEGRPSNHLIATISVSALWRSGK